MSAGEKWVAVVTKEGEVAAVFTKMADGKAYARKTVKVWSKASGREVVIKDWGKTATVELAGGDASEKIRIELFRLR